MLIIVLSGQFGSFLFNFGVRVFFLKWKGPAQPSLCPSYNPAGAAQPIHPSVRPARGLDGSTDTQLARNDGLPSPASRPRGVDGRSGWPVAEADELWVRLIVQRPNQLIYVRFQNITMYLKKKKKTGCSRPRNQNSLFTFTYHLGHLNICGVQRYDCYLLPR
jgi:hypothetical protein